jgi:hypothetical protein
MKLLVEEKPVLDHLGRITKMIMVATLVVGDTTYRREAERSEIAIVRVLCSAGFLRFKQREGELKWDWLLEIPAEGLNHGSS